MLLRSAANPQHTLAYLEVVIDVVGVPVDHVYLSRLHDERLESVVGTTLATRFTALCSLPRGARMTNCFSLSFFFFFLVYDAARIAEVEKDKSTRLSSAPPLSPPLFSYQS